MKPSEFTGQPDGIYRIKEEGYWDALIKVVDGRQIYELRNDNYYTYFKPKDTLIAGMRSTFMIEPATREEEEYFNRCLEAGKYLNPPSVEFNGLWADFHKEDGDYFVEKGDSTWIVRCLDGEDIYRVYTNGLRFYEGRHAWGKSNEYEIRKAVQSEIEHLNSCIEQGYYQEPPRLLNSSRELGDGYYKIKRKGVVWLTKKENGDFIGTINRNSQVFYTGGSHWDNGILISNPTKDEILQLDTSIAKDQYVSLKDAKFAREFGFTGGLKTGRVSCMPETDSGSTDIVFKGKYGDFQPEDGEYVLKQPVGAPYITKYQNGELFAEIDVGAKYFTTSDTWSPHFSIEARRATTIETKQLDASISKGKYVPMDEVNLVEPNIWDDTEIGDFVLYNEFGEHTLVRNTPEGQFRVLLNVKGVQHGPHEGSCSFKPTTEEQSAHLNACIVADKFVPLREVKENEWLFEGKYSNFDPGTGYYHMKHFSSTYINKYVDGVLVCEINPYREFFEEEASWSSQDTIKVKSATNDEILQLDTCISRGEYVSLEEALARDLGKPDAIIENNDGNLVPVDFKTHNSVFDLKNCNTILGVHNSDNRLYLEEIQRLKETLTQQQEEINKLSQTWIQKLKNMIGPLV